MEISPITGVRDLPARNAPPVEMEMELSAVFDIENYARIGDETYTPHGGKSAGGHEDEFDDPIDDDDPVPKARMRAGGPEGKISFFA